MVTLDQAVSLHNLLTSHAEIDQTKDMKRVCISVAILLDIPIIISGAGMTGSSNRLRFIESAGSTAMATTGWSKNQQVVSNTQREAAWILANLWASDQQPRQFILYLSKSAFWTKWNGSVIDLFETWCVDLHNCMTMFLEAGTGKVYGQQWLLNANIGRMVQIQS